MCDRDLPDPPNSSVGRRSEQDPAVRDGDVVIDRAVGEPHPVGVVERMRAGQGPAKSALVREIERSDIDLLARAPLGMPSERPDLVTAAEQLAGDGSAGVAERAGNNVELSHRAPFRSPGNLIPASTSTNP